MVEEDLAVADDDFEAEITTRGKTPLPNYRKWLEVRRQVISFADIQQEDVRMREIAKNMINKALTTSDSAIKGKF